MISLIVAFLFSGMFLAAWLIFNPPQKKDKASGSVVRNKILNSLNINKYQAQAEKIGWKISKKEIALIIGFAFLLVACLSAITKNPLVLIAGVIIGFMAPKMAIEQKRRSLRINLLSKLPDPLRLLLSRLPDQQNITRAIETTRDEINDPQLKKIFDRYLSEVNLGASVRDALISMKYAVNLKKFDIVVENLIQAHQDGITQEAINALDKAIEAIEFDLRAIEKVKQTSNQKKKNLYTALGIVCGFIPLVSMLRTGDTNIYLETIPGKIIILLHVLGGVYVIIKGEEYLSLNLEEL